MAMIEFKTREGYYNFFEAIPEEKWCVGMNLSDQSEQCALGNLRASYSYTIVDLIRIDLNQIYDINDGTTLDLRALGNHPKERVLNAIVLLESGILEDV